MRRVLLIALVLLLTALTASSKGSSRPVPVPLKDGSRVVGYIEENSCTNESLVLRDMRTKRKITIPWSKLKPDAAHKLRVDPYPWRCTCFEYVAVRTQMGACAGANPTPRIQRSRFPLSYVGRWDWRRS